MYGEPPEPFFGDAAPDGSNGQLEELVAEAANCLARRMRPYQIANHFKDLLGKPISTSALNLLLRHARDYIVENAGRSHAEHYALSVAFWENVIATSGSVKNQIAGQKGLERLLGLGAVQQNPEDPDTQAAKLREALDQMDDIYEED